MKMYNAVITIRKPSRYLTFPCSQVFHKVMGFDTIMIPLIPRGRSCVIDLFFIFVLQNCTVIQFLKQIIKNQTPMPLRDITNHKNCSFFPPFF